MIRKICERKLMIVGVLSYIVVLNLSYIKVISPTFSYAGYIYCSPHVVNFVIACFVALLPSSWMPIVLKRPSQLVYWLLYIFVLVPAAFIPLYTLKLSQFYISIFSCMLLLVFWMLNFIYRLPTLRLVRLNLSEKMFIIVILLISAIFYIILVIKFGFPSIKLSLRDVYGLRADYVARSSRFVSYILEYQANAINPFLIAHGTIKRNILTLLLGTIGQLFIFSITGFKSVFISIFSIIFMLLIIVYKRRRFGLYMLCGIVALILFSYFASFILNDVFLLSLFVRRLIITPGLLTGYYFEFFFENPKVYLGHSIFSKIVQYPYSLMPRNMIGLNYFGDARAGANANIWADAFANFGFGGVVFFTILLGLILWILDSVAKDRDWRIATATIGHTLIALINSALLTSLLSHGILFVILLVYFMPKENKVLPETLWASLENCPQMCETILKKHKGGRS